VKRSGEKEEDSEGGKDDGQDASPVLKQKEANAANDLHRGVNEKCYTKKMSETSQHSLDGVALGGKSGESRSQTTNEENSCREKRNHSSAKELKEGGKSDASRADGVPPVRM
jgi:hypothetical protein